jgi:hypothetical protein
MTNSTKNEKNLSNMRFIGRKLMNLFAVLAGVNLSILSRFSGRKN